MSRNQIALLVCAMGCSAIAAEQVPSGKLAALVANAPLRFEPNLGQADPQVRFVSRGSGTTLLLTETDAYLVVSKPANPECHQAGRACKDALIWERSTVRVRLKGAQASSVNGVEKLSSVTNYILGNDPSKWRTVPNYARVESRGIYPGIDMVYYGKQHRLEYDFVVAPGADPKNIQLAYEGVKSLRLDDRGDLVLATAAGTIRQHRPIVYQNIDGRRVEVASSYRLEGREVGFELASYDQDRPLVIDPVLAFQGIVGTTDADNPRDVASDPTGNIYMTGITDSASFPTLAPGTLTAGKVWVQKYRASDGSLEYSSLVGTSSPTEASQSWSIAVNGQSQPVVAGFTDAGSFPVTAATAFQPVKSGFRDAFVFKLNATGTGLAYGTFLGSTQDDLGLAVAIDGSNNVYVAGETGSTGFPTQFGLTGLTRAGLDGFVAKLPPTDAASVPSAYFGSILGGSGNDTPWSIAVVANSIYVVGETKSSNFFPAGTPGFDTTFNSSASTADAFVAKFNPIPGSGSITLAYGTYLGGSERDVAYGLSVDAGGLAYVGGQTVAGVTPFPTANAWRTTVGLAAGFITKFNAAGTGLVYSTAVGGAGGISGINDVIVDGAGALFFTGFTTAPDFPGVNAPANMCDVPTGATNDVIIGKMQPSGASPEWLGVTGGSNADTGFSIALDPAGSAWVAGSTTSFDFPIINSSSTFRGRIDGSTFYADGFLSKVAPTGTAREAPDVTAPNPGQRIETDSFAFRWTSVSGATSYQTQVFNLDNQQLANSITTTSTVWAIVLPNGTYTFKVRACFGGGTTDCSVYCARNFTVSISGLGSLPAPQITAPANGAALTSSAVTFSWTPAPGTNKFYDFRLFNEADNNKLELRLQFIGNLTSEVYTLKSGSYRIEMRSCNPLCGLPAVSKFTVALGGIPSTAPTGISCSVVNDNNQNRLNCSWNALAGADFYFVHLIQPNTGPGGGALTVAGTQIGPNSISLLVPNGFANFIVSGCNGDGCGPFSSPIGVTPAFGNPTVPIVAEPFNGFVVDAGNAVPGVTFTWNRIAGDNGTNFRYRLYVQDFSRNTASVDVLTDNNFHAAYLNPFTRYDVLVVAIPKAGGANVQGPANGFVAKGAVPNAPSFVAPTIFSTVGGGNVRLGWTPVPDSNGNTGNRLYHVVLNGPNPQNFSTTDLTKLVGLGAGSYNGVVRSCTIVGATACNPANDVGWGPVSGSPTAQGGPTVFTVQ